MMGAIPPIPPMVLYHFKPLPILLTRILQEQALSCSTKCHFFEKL